MRRAHVHLRARARAGRLGAPGLLCAAACAAAAMLAAGCHDLPDLGVCGNGIVEEANGEACDDGGPSATCTASCTLQCMAMDKAPSSYVLVDSINNLYCPDASYRCGTDLICRAPSGTFQAVSPPQAFDVNNAPVVGDVDNDGLVDLVGSSPTKIYTRFASTFGDPLGEVIVQDSPSSDAPYAIFDRDPGRRDPMQSNLEIAVPTEGVALLRSNGERFAPELELPLAVTGQTAGLVVRDPDAQIGDVIVTIESQSATPTIRVTRNEVKSPDMVRIVVPEQRLQDCVGAQSGAWRLLALKAAPDRRSFVVVTQQVLGTAWHVCHYAQAGGSWTLAQLDFAAGAPKTIALANLDADACLELALRIDGAPGAFSKIDAIDPDCALQPTVQPLPLLDAWQGPGAGQGLLAAGQIVDGGPDELVLEGGVYQACGGALPCGGLAAGTYVRVAQPTKVPWHAAVTVDINGDDVLDVVAARGGEPDVDITRGGSIPNVYRASTSVPITSLVAGDFDGDRLGDAAMIEGTPSGDRIAVLFGTREAIVGAPVTMSSPRGQLVLDRLSEIHWLPTKRGADGVDDLLVADLSQAPPRVGVVFGDAARIMTTPRFSPASVDGSLLRGVTAGRFVSPELGVQIVALTANQGLLYDVNMGNWVGQVPLPPGMSIGPPLASLRDRGMVRGAARGMGNSVVVFSLRGMAITTCPEATTDGPPLTMRGVDIDDDGVDELAVQYDLSSQGRQGTQVQLFDVVDSEGSPGCKLVSILDDVLEDCVDLANAGTALVAICRGSSGAPANEVRLLTPIGPRSYVKSGPIAHVQGDGRFAVAGDFDGDGVRDVVIGARRVDAVAVQLLKQCPAHDTRGCLVPVAAPPAP
jgi:hypothetical protein